MDAKFGIDSGVCWTIPARAWPRDSAPILGGVSAQGMVGVEEVDHAAAFAHGRCARREKREESGPKDAWRHCGSLGGKNLRADITPSASAAEHVHPVEGVTAPRLTRSEWADPTPIANAAQAHANPAWDVSLPADRKWWTIEPGPPNTADHARAPIRSSAIRRKSVFMLLSFTLSGSLQKTGTYHSPSPIPPTHRHR